MGDCNVRGPETGPNTAIVAIGERIFSLLRQIDEEADTIDGKVRSGIVNYACHYRANFGPLPSRKYERPISERLAMLLREAGQNARTECLYPGSRNKCDVVASFGPARALWLEDKMAWKAWFADQKYPPAKCEYVVEETEMGRVKATADTTYRGYLSGEGKTHSAAQDIDKLDDLSSRDTDYVAGLLIGFDHVDLPMQEDVETEVIGRKHLLSNGWTVLGPYVWCDPAYDRCRICCWLWGRRATE